MSQIAKIFSTEQAKLSQLNLNQLNHILGNGQTVIYIDSNNFLRIAEKDNNIVYEKNPTGDIIKSLPVENTPTTFPTADTGYALMAVRDGSNYKLIWGWMDTIGNYNVISGNTTYTVVVTDPTHQIFNVNTPGDYKFNGDISISVNGDGAFAAKKYSIDGGLTFTPLNSTPNFFYTELGSITGETYDLVIKDAADAVLYTETINIAPPDYSFDEIDINLYTPNFVSHVIYKTDDINPTNPHIIEVVVEDDNTLLPGLYKYRFISDLNGLIFETNFIPDQIVKFPIPFPDTYRAEVIRINSGYIELGKWSSPSTIVTYSPNNFLWSKNNGQTFSVASFITQPFVLQNNGDTIRINYLADEIGEFGGFKKIFMRLTGTGQVYQSTHELPQSQIPSNPSNVEVIVNNLEGSVQDIDFATPFTSDLYFSPTLVTQADPYWVPSPSTPGNPRIDFEFKMQFLSTAFIGNPTELFMVIEDLSGNLITKEDGTLISSSSITGMVYEFYISDFKSIISPYFNQIVRIRFTFDPDISIPDPSNQISSKLKFVRYV